MPKKRFTAEEIIRKLREAEVLLSQGQPIDTVCRGLGISRADLLSVAQRIWWVTYGPGTPVKRFGTGEWSAEKTRGGSGAGQSDAAGGALGKNVSPAARRKSVAHVRGVFRVSERRACRVIRIARSSQRYRPRTLDAEAPLTRRIVAFATQYGRYGYRRITALLRREGWGVNHKRVERIWRKEGLKVPLSPAETQALVVE